MNRLVLLCLTVALVAGGAGCAGKDFTRPAASSLELGKTTMAQVRDRMGEPRQESNVLKEDVRIKTLTYGYAEAPAFGQKVPARAMSFYFTDGLLVGYDFLSSFDDDKSNFDEDRISAIKKGETTEIQVVTLLGAPGGRYIHPMIKERGKTAFVYQYLRMDRISAWPVARVEVATNKRLQITFAGDGKVDDIVLSVMEKK
jgi:hypothetical protein